jgi:hypothetical protein
MHTGQYSLTHAEQLDSPMSTAFRPHPLHLKGLGCGFGGGGGGGVASTTSIYSSCGSSFLNKSLSHPIFFTLKSKLIIN